MKKVYLETYGCQMNVSDSERVATSLRAQGYEITKEQESADVILINTCSVREKAENKLYTQVGRIRHNREDQPIIGVMGCVAQLEGETLFSKSSGVDFVIGTRAVGRVANAIQKVLNGQEDFIDLGEREKDYDWTVDQAQRQSPHVAFVPIIEGCNKFCTYCIVPFSRGRETSFTASDIIRQVLEIKREGVKEVHLIGQNVNSYRPKSDTGMSHVNGKTAFSKLLRAVAETGIERIKFNTSFPRDFHPDIVDAMEEYENLCNWVHLPVQSGSDRVLKAMKRGHTIDSYIKKVDRIRDSGRKNSLTTDIIVGFPGETEEDFRRTEELVDYCGYDSAYIFKYSRRPGTPAYEMEDTVSFEEKTERFLRLEAVHKKAQQRTMEGYKGRVVSVLVERLSSRTKGGLTGHSTCHKLMNFVGNEELIGKIVNVKVTEIKVNSLFGEIVN